MRKTKKHAIVLMSRAAGREYAANVSRITGGLMSFRHAISRTISRRRMTGRLKITSQNAGNEDGYLNSILTGNNDIYVI